MRWHGGFGCVRCNCTVYFAVVATVDSFALLSVCASHSHCLSIPPPPPPPLPSSPPPLPPPPSPPPPPFAFLPPPPSHQCILLPRAFSLYLCLPLSFSFSHTHMSLLPLAPVTRVAVVSPYVCTCMYIRRHMNMYMYIGSHMNMTDMRHANVNRVHLAGVSSRALRRRQRASFQDHFTHSAQGAARQR